MPAMKYEELAKFSNAELEKIFAQGLQPDPEVLAGWEFRGYNTPAFARLLGVQKFIKGMFRDAEGRVEGYNVSAKQNGLAGPWEYKAQSPKRFGFYDVYRVRGGDRDNKHPNATLLNYGTSKRNSIVDPWMLRDYVVQVDPDNRDLYLGKAYVAAGPLRIPTSFFIIERFHKGIDEIR